MDKTPGEIKIKYLSERVILEKANLFLDKYNSKMEVPVPLEKIAEIDLGINFLTVPNLKNLIECDGYISDDFSTITFDDYIFNNCEVRARFTLAHELGHFFLHQDLYNSYEINDIESFIKFQKLIGDKSWRSLEIQANIFAGFVLFPYKPLKKLIENNLVKSGGLNQFAVSDLQKLILEMQETFGVSGQACLVQLKKYFPDLLKVAGDAIF